MNRYATIALGVASAFLLVMAVPLDSPPLFYMATATIATVLAARLQAWLAVRWLRIERFVPPSVAVGEPVTVELIVWSERRVQRPLVTVTDGLPSKLRREEISPAWPIAPSYEQPIRTRYSFRPLRRGRYRWNRVNLIAADALGLIRIERALETEPAELVVYPAPIPLDLELLPTSGQGLHSLESGNTKGSGLEMHSIREYAPGDPLRLIHWKSSAKYDRLMVKEFESGAGLNIAFVLQRQFQTDISDEEGSTFESMCGNVLALAEHYLDRGAKIAFPGLEDESLMARHPGARVRQVREILVDAQPDSFDPLSIDLPRIQRSIDADAGVVVLVSVADPGLPQALLGLGDRQRTALVYNPRDYDPNFKGNAASDPEFVALLESVGCRVVPAPRLRRRS